MKPGHFSNPLSVAKRWVVTALFCLVAIAFVWQGAFVADNIAIAASDATLIASTDAGDRVQDKASTDARRAKNFVQDTKEKVEDTANKNARRVERAAEDNDGFFARRAKRDADLIEKRAEEDASRTQKAVDNTKNAVERAVDGIKDAFND